MNESDLLLLNSTIESMRQVFMQSMDASQPIPIEQGLIQSGISVLIGIMGDLQGRLVFHGDLETFSRLGESMFGMPLEGEMLHSFIGEMANMIAGKTSTILSDKGKHVDITPPTIMLGQLEIYGFEAGIHVSVHLEEIGKIHIALLFHTKGGST
ncbi:MAG: chemotaxis protein CheX [Bacillota bacterium]